MSNYIGPQCTNRLIMDISFVSNTSYKTAYLAKNKVLINVDPASLTIEDRSKLRYYLTLVVPTYSGAPLASWIELPAMEGVEEPLETLSDSSIVARGAFFEIGNILKSLVSSSRPDFNQVLIKGIPNYVSPLRFKSEIKNDSVAIGSPVLSDIKYTICGGISESDHHFWGNEFIKKSIGEAHRFLIHSSFKRLYPSQPFFLYFLNNLQPSAQAIKLRAFRYYEDGTSDAEAFNISVMATTFMNVYCIPSHPDLIGGSRLTGENRMTSYSVWLVNENNQVISEVVNCSIDYSDYQLVKFILFRNSLGAYESIFLPGRTTEKMGISRDLIEQTTSYSHLGFFSEKLVNRVNGERELTLNSSWIEENEKELYLQLAMSDDVLIVSNQQYIPMVLMNDGHLIYDSDEKVVGRSFTFRYGALESNVSNLPVFPTAEARATGWRSYGTMACELDTFGKRTGKGKISHLELYYLDDDSFVLPHTVKLNVEGTEGYIGIQTTGLCSTTPYLSNSYSAIGTFRKSTCGNGYTGGFATISIVANRWGSEASQSDADAKAIDEWRALNTQVYADANGTCTLVNSGNLRAKFFTFFPDGTGLPPEGIYSNTPTLNVLRNSLFIDSTVLSGLGLPIDYVAARFTGFIKAPISGQIQLYVTSDDGVRLKWDNLLVLDAWINRGATENIMTLDVIENQYYPFLLDFFEYNGSEYLSVSWSYTGQAKIAIPSANMFYE